MKERSQDNHAASAAHLNHNRRTRAPNHPCKAFCASPSPRRVMSHALRCMLRCVLQRCCRTCPAPSTNSYGSSRVEVLSMRLPAARGREGGWNRRGRATARRGLLFSIQGVDQPLMQATATQGTKQPTAPQSPLFHNPNHCNCCPATRHCLAGSPNATTCPAAKPLPHLGSPWCTPPSAPPPCRPAAAMLPLPAWQGGTGCQPSTRLRSILPHESDGCLKRWDWASRIYCGVPCCMTGQLHTVAGRVPRHVHAWGGQLVLSWRSWALAAAAPDGEDLQARGERYEVVGLCRLSPHHQRGCHGSCASQDESPPGACIDSRAAARTACCCVDAIHAANFDSVLALATHRSCCKLS